tara:strand:- start:4278 stop:6179 length:1902 start_codon:yes stop_codon:yes gene_type:complete
MALVNFADLDFDQIKTSIKDYLRSNSNFTDYDFEGSNLSTIVDVLAYNTYITSYNTNMVTNEVFIDSATLRENVVSLARNVGYVPRSRKSSRAKISFFVDTSNFTNAPSSLILKAGVVATTNPFGAQSYTFIIPEDITAPVTDNIAEFTDITVYEGSLITQNFTVSSLTPNQRFILDNSGIDTSLLKVNVRSNSSATATVTYNFADSLFDVKSDSTVFYLQEIEDENYELIFGDGIFGKKLKEPEYITASYTVTNGAEANNISAMNFAGTLQDESDRAVTSGISLITVTESSHSGAAIETVESIKKYGTRIYASRNRAVTASDYEALIPSIYPETESVSAYGGETLTPPQFGKVFISIKPNNDRYLSNLIKDNISRELNKYNVAGIVTEIVDLKYLYVQTNSNVYYNPNLAPSTNTVKTAVISNINTYADSTELNKFGARFKYSQFGTIIDESHQSITSNITTVTIRRDLRAILNAFAEYEICYGNRFHISNNMGYNIKSSAFTVSGLTGNVYLSDVPDSDLKTGSINLFKLDSPTQPRIVRRNVGSIDYIKGEIKLNPINIISTQVNRGTPLIEIEAVPYSNDVIGLQDLYLQLDTSNAIVTAWEDDISSGAELAGTSHQVSSSYSNGVFVR